MNQYNQTLSDLLQTSTPAEAFWAQLPEWIQQKAMAQQDQIHSTQDLQAFARMCQREAPQ